MSRQDTRVGEGGMIGKGIWWGWEGNAWGVVESGVFWGRVTCVGGVGWVRRGKGGTLQRPSQEVIEPSRSLPSPSTERTNKKQNKISRYILTLNEGE